MKRNSRTKGQMMQEVRSLRRQIAGMKAYARGSSVYEELFRLLIQAIPDIIYMLDSNGRFVFVSESVRQLGYEPRKLIGRYFGDILHPDDSRIMSRRKILPKYRGKTTGAGGSPKLFDERRTGKRYTKNLEARILKKGKGKAPVAYCSTEIHSRGEWTRGINNAGKILLGSVGIIRDITERKRAEKTEQLERFSRMLIEFQEEERKRVAQELHDDIGQILSAIKLTLGMIRKDHARTGTYLDGDLKEAIHLTDRAMDDVRRMSLRLRPALLDSLGLIECLKQEIEFIQQRSGIAVNFTFEDLGCRLSSRKEVVLYRIAQEALTNIIKHAEAKSAMVSLGKGDSEVILKIKDKGQGFAVSRLRRIRGMGVLGMKERIESVGGTLRIVSHPGKGTVVEARVPC